MSKHHFERIKFSTITMPYEKSAWYYSYQDLQDKVNEVCANHIIKKVYVGLQGYLESFYHRENYYSFAYSGGAVILIFDNIAIELCIHAMGMIQYREINLCDIKIKETKDFPPNDMGLNSDNYFYDLAEQFELSYEDQKVLGVLVDRIDMYSFTLDGFDKEKAKTAAETNSLPNSVRFQLENGVDFGIYGDDMEYFNIELKN